MGIVAAAFAMALLLGLASTAFGAGGNPSNGSGGGVLAPSLLLTAALIFVVAVAMAYTPKSGGGA